MINGGVKFDVGLWSIAISVIALFVAVAKDFLLPVVLKPKLHLEGKNSEEYVQLGTDENGRKTYWLRLRISNDGGLFSSTARKCYVKLIEIRDEHNQKIQPLDAFPLNWVHYTDVKVDLAKGEEHFLTLAFEPENKRILVPFPPQYLPNELIKSEKLGPSTYTFKLGVYGDNFDPLFKEFKIKLTSKFGELKFVE